MNGLVEEKTKIPKKILFCLMGAMLGGVMWRLRGEHGWGSSWGVLTLGMVLAMYLYTLCGRKKDISLFHIGLCAASFMLTTPTWGAFVGNIDGLCDVAQGITLEVTPWSAVIMMMILGFPIPLFFSLLCSRMFSEKEYKIQHYLIALGVYYAVLYLCDASLSHVILKLFQPEAARGFESFLVGDYAGLSAYSVYMKHFADIAWAKKLTCGRLYFSEIATISSALGALAVIICVRFVFHDKKGGRLMLGSSLSMAFSIALSNLTFFFCGGGYHNEQFTPVLQGQGWSLWEFFTGFFYALLLTAIVLFINRKQTPAIRHDVILSVLPKRVFGVVEYLFTVGFAFALTLLRPVASKCENTPAAIIVYVVGFALVIIAGLFMIQKKVPPLSKTDAFLFCMKVLPVYLSAQVMIYLFVGNRENLGVLMRLPQEFSAVQWLVCGSYVLFMTIFLVLAKKYFKNHA